MSNFVPYGFCESWLADKLGIENIPFPLTDSIVAAVGKNDFEAISRTFGGTIVRSSFDQAFVSIHEYWSDTNPLDSLTDGPTKETDRYIRAITARGDMTTEQTIDKAWRKICRTAYYKSITTTEIPIGAVVLPDAAPEPEAPVLIDIISGDFTWIEESMPGGENNKYIAKILRSFPLARAYIEGGRWVVCLDENQYNESVCSIEKIKGIDVIYTSGQVYGDMVQDMLYLATYLLNGERWAVGSPAKPVATISSMGLYEYGGTVAVERTVPFSDIPVVVTDYKFPAGSNIILAGDYEIALIDNLNVKVMFPNNSKIMEHVVGIINGKKYNYKFNFLAEAFASVLHKVSPGGHYVYTEDCRHDTVYEAAFILADKIGKSIVITSNSGTVNKLIKTALRITEDIVKKVSRLIIIISPVTSSEFFHRDVATLALGVTFSGVFVPHITEDAYTKYDYILRDTVSNNVFAVLRKNQILVTLCGFFDIKKLVRLLEGMAFRIDQNRTYEEIHAADEEAYRSITEESKGVYGKMFVKDVMKSIEQKKVQLSRSEQTYNELMDQIMTLASTIRSASMELSCIDTEKIMKDNEEIAEKDFTNILGIDAVSNIVVSGTALNIYTHNIYVQHDKNKKWYDIGTFHIRLDMGASEYNSNTTTRIFNTKYAANAYENGMNAPHVFRGGNLCHGNLSRGISDCYKNRDVFGVVYQIILFLQTANLDDVAGSKLDKWVEVSAEIATGAKRDSASLYGVRETSAFDEAFNAAISG